MFIEVRDEQFLLFFSIQWFHHWLYLDRKEKRLADTMKTVLCFKSTIPITRKNLRVDQLISLIPAYNSLAVFVC